MELVVYGDEPEGSVRPVGSFRFQLPTSLFAAHDCSAEIIGYLRQKAANLGFDGVMDIRRAEPYCVGTPFVREP